MTRANVNTSCSKPGRIRPIRRVRAVRNSFARRANRILIYHPTTFNLDEFA